MKAPEYTENLKQQLNNELIDSSSEQPTVINVQGQNIAVFNDVISTNNILFPQVSQHLSLTLDTLETSVNNIEPDTTTKRPAIIKLSEGYSCSCELRNQLKNHCDELHECLQSPVEEYSFFKKSKNLYFNIDQSQLNALNSLPSVERVSFVDDLQETVHLSDHIINYPGHPRNYYGGRLGIGIQDAITKINNRVSPFTKIDTIVSPRSTWSYRPSSVWPSENIVNTYCQPLSNYLDINNTSNYGLYVHSYPIMHGEGMIENTARTIYSTNSGQNVDVIILDSGIDHTHPEFLDDEGNSRVVLEDWTTYRDDDNNIILPSLPANYHQDTNGHGTFCASIVGGRRLGWAPGCKLYSLKAITNNGITVEQALKLVKAFIKRKKVNGNTRPTIINNSWGSSWNGSLPCAIRSVMKTTGTTDNPPIISGPARVLEYNTLVDEITEEGGVFVVAAGNSNIRLPLIKNSDRLAWYLTTFARDLTSNASRSYLSNNFKYHENIKTTLLNLSTNELYTNTPGFSSYTTFKHTQLQTIPIGSTPNITYATNSQEENPVINVGCVHPVEDDHMYVHPNKKLNEHTGAVNLNTLSGNFIKSYYSNFGPGVDIFACGYNVLGAVSNDRSAYSVANFGYPALTDEYATGSGTSFACPQVVGILARYLNDHPTATGLDCKQWLITNSIKDQVLEFDSNCEPEQGALIYGTDSSKLSTYESIGVQIHEDYFKEIYEKEGYNKITILNTVSSYDEKSMYHTMLYKDVVEADNLIFVPVSHAAKIGDYYGTNPLIADRDGAGTDILDISRTSEPFDCYAFGMASYPVKNYDDTYASNYYTKAHTHIDVYEKTNSGIKFVTKVDHPFTLNPTNSAFLSYGWHYSDIRLNPFSGLKHPPGYYSPRYPSEAITRSHYIQKPSETSFTPGVGTRLNLRAIAWTGAELFASDSPCSIAYAGGKLVGVDNNGLVCIYEKQSNSTFTLVQTITAPHVREGEKFIKPTWTSNGVDPDLTFTGVRNVSQSSDGEYIAITVGNFTLSSYIEINQKLLGEFDWLSGLSSSTEPIFSLTEGVTGNGFTPLSFTAKEAVYLPGAAQIYKWNGTQYTHLSTIVPDRHKNYMSFRDFDTTKIMYLSTNDLYNYNFDTCTNLRGFFDKDNNYILLDMVSFDFQNIPMSAQGHYGVDFELDIPNTASNVVNYFECYNINNTTVTYVTSGDPSTSISPPLCSVVDTHICNTNWKYNGYIDDFSSIQNNAGFLCTANYEQTHRTKNNFSFAINYSNGVPYVTNRGYSSQDTALFWQVKPAALKVPNLEEDDAPWLIRHPNYEVNGMVYSKLPPVFSATTGVQVNSAKHVSSFTEIATHVREYDNFPKKISFNTTNNSLSVEEVKFAEKDNIDNNYFYRDFLNNINHGDIHHCVFDDGTGKRMMNGTYLTEHAPSGNKIVLSKGTGVAYFLKPDASAPHGYKTFKLLHGRASYYPFAFNLFPTALGIYDTSILYNNRYGFSYNSNNTASAVSYPMAAFFHTEDTFTVMYAIDASVENTSGMIASAMDMHKPFFVTFKIDLGYQHGESNITEEHLKYNKLIYTNGHNILDTPNRMLQAYPKNYILLPVDNNNNNTITYEGSSYTKIGHTVV
jgi:subtilisin family serine protease